MPDTNRQEGTHMIYAVPYFVPGIVSEIVYELVQANSCSEAAAVLLRSYPNAIVAGFPSIA